MPVAYITSMAEFTSVVSDTRPAIVEFWAEWCTTCQETTELFDQLAAQNPQGNFYRLDIEEVREVPLALGVRNLPAFKVYVKGVQIGELVGKDPVQLTVRRFVKGHAYKTDPSCRDLAARSEDPEYVIKRLD